MDDLGATKRWIQMDAESSWDRPAVALEFYPVWPKGLGDDVFDQEIGWHLRVFTGFGGLWSPKPYKETRKEIQVR